MNQITKSLAAIAVSTALLVTAALPVQAQDREQRDVERHELAQMDMFLSLMQQFFGIIESMHEVASDPEKSAIFQLHKIQEAYEERGEKPRTAVVMRRVLEETDNTTIRAATYLMLGDLLKENGRSDEAIEVLRRGLDESLRAAD
ncbi:MAG: hypothetical protein HKO55_05830 [Gammaproteobacteria bacterium]|nr:hypothetical protein [Gammaproteobacteria bacterium]NNM20773.1 hypothetical protein [Gammaproteobacteria bacterium]